MTGSRGVWGPGAKMPAVPTLAVSSPDGGSAQDGFLSYLQHCHFESLNQCHLFVLTNPPPIVGWHAWLHPRSVPTWLLVTSWTSRAMIFVPWSSRPACSGIFQRCRCKDRRTEWTEDTETKNQPSGKRNTQRTRRNV